MNAYHGSIQAAESCDVLLIIGSTGEVAPANQIPMIAKRNDAIIIEINPESSRYTAMITDIHLPGRAGEMMKILQEKVEKLVAG